MQKRILITGATGNVGIATITSLSRLGQEVEIVAGVLDLEKDRAKFMDLPVQLVAFDFEKQETFATALAGVSVLFLLRPPQLTDAKKYMQPLVDAAKVAPVAHIVFLSVQGADTKSLIPHYKIEQLISKSEIPFTFLRPAYFMQNFLTTLKKDLTERNEIYLPAAEAKFTLVDLVDVGEVGARVLCNTEKHRNRAYDLTNQERLTFAEMADQLTEVLGKKITFRSPNLVSFFLRKRRSGTASMFILVMIMLHYLPRFSAKPTVSNSIEDILGRQAGTFLDFVTREKENLS